MPPYSAINGNRLAFLVMIFLRPITESSTEFDKTMDPRFVFFRSSLDYFIHLEEQENDRR
jgi:hypothetical protein